MFGLEKLFGKSEQPLRAVEGSEQEQIAPITREALLADTRMAKEFFAEPYTNDGKEGFLTSGPRWLVEMATEVSFGDDFFIKDVVQAIITITEESQATRPEEIQAIDVENLLRSRLNRGMITKSTDEDKFSSRMGEPTVFDALEDSKP